MKTWTGVAAVLTALALAPAALRAQEAEGRERGARSVSISTHGDASVGVWTRLSPRADLGLGVTLVRRSETQGDNEGDGTTVELEPALKLYAGRSGDFHPYTYVSLLAGYSHDEVSNAVTEIEGSSTRRRLGAALGIGMDWVAASRISIGGHVGVVGGLEDFDSEFNNGSEQSGDGWFAQTFNSGITVHLFL